MGDENGLHVLVVDDEPLARQRISDLLARERDINKVTFAENGKSAVEMIQKERPALVFLDIQMPGMSGLEVVAAVGPENMPATLFVTAFDQFAVKAFDLAAIDYLVKPFDDERFLVALNRARKALERNEMDRLSHKLAALLSKASIGQKEVELSAAVPPPYLERISVETRGQLRVVPVVRIDYITASGPYAELHVGEVTHVLRERMQTLEERLDPARFFRIHRSAIVRLGAIDSLRHSAGGDYGVRLKSGVELSLSRGRREELQRRLGVNK